MSMTRPESTLLRLWKGFESCPWLIHPLLVCEARKRIAEHTVRALIELNRRPL